MAVLRLKPSIRKWPVGAFTQLSYPNLYSMTINEYTWLSSELGKDKVVKKRDGTPTSITPLYQCKLALYQPLPRRPSQTMGQPLCEQTDWLNFILVSYLWYHFPPVQLVSTRSMTIRLKQYPSISIQWRVAFFAHLFLLQFSGHDGDGDFFSGGVIHMEEMLYTLKHILYCTSSALYNLNLATNHPQPVLISGRTASTGYVEGKGKWENYCSVAI